MTARGLAALNGLVLVGGLLVGGLVVTDDPSPAGASAGAGAGTPQADGTLALLPSTGGGPATASAPATTAPPTTAPATTAPSTRSAPLPAGAPAPPAAVTTPGTAPPGSGVTTSVPRTATTTGFAPYAQVGPVVLHAPGDVVEAIGYHQAGHDGAQPQVPRPGPVRAGSLEDRGRGTHPDSATDIVVDPAREVRSPVTGRVVRAGTYDLYCDSVDQYLVVEPDARPGWEVKVLHVQGLSVGTGDRVQAGVTVVAAGARPLPFSSQVDAFTAEPSWPHVHVEVVDPSVPDRPGTGGGGGC